MYNLRRRHSRFQQYGTLLKAITTAAGWAEGFVGEPGCQVMRVSSVTADDAEIAGSSHRYVAYDTLEGQFLAIGALRPSAALEARLAFALKLETPVRVRRRCAHVLQHLGARIQQSPSVQHFRVRPLVAVVQRSVLLIQQSDVTSGVAEAVLNDFQVVDRLRPRV